VWLVFMIIANLSSAVGNLATGSFLRQAFPNAPGWTMPVMSVVGLVNVAWAVALLQWKKWGFYGFVATAAVAVVVNMMIGMSIVASGFFAFVGIALLYGVLQIGGDRSGWSQLE
jgi:hypothetical protein